MDVILKQSGNRFGVYLDKKLATVLENKTLKEATEWVEANLKDAKIHIIK